MIQFLHQLSLGTRGFFSRVRRGASSAFGRRHEQTLFKTHGPNPETALEKPLAPRVSSALFEIKTVYNFKGSSQFPSP